MPKILHTYRYTGKPWEILKSVVPDGFIIETLKEPTYECLLKQCYDADYFLVSGRIPIDKEVLSTANHLKMIHRTGVGIEMLDIDSIKEKNIPVYVNKGINARSVAEHTLALILSSLKNIPLIDRNVRNGIWKKQETGVSCHELYAKSVGLVGMGAIGKQVAKYLNAFGARVYYTDIFRLDPEQESELNLNYIPSFEELLDYIDILSFHCPLTKENRGLLNKDTLSMMKDGAIVVNTARGKLIDEKALYESLINGKIRCAALDVHYEEPIPMDSPLKTLDNVIFSPHIAGLSFETFHSMMKDAVSNIVSFENGDFNQIEDKKLISC